MTVSNGAIILVKIYIYISWNCTFCTHCNENPIYVFPEMKLRGHVPNSYIHVSVSDLYIPRIGLPIWLQQNRQTDPWIYKSLIDAWPGKLRNRTFWFCFGNNEAVQFYFWEYINRNQTFILDSHRFSFAAQWYYEAYSSWIAVIHHAMTDRSSANIVLLKITENCKKKPSAWKGRLSWDYPFVNRIGRMQH